MVMRVDAHCHLWHLGRGDYAWLAKGPAALAPLRRDFDLDDLPAAAPGAGVASTILVQAAPTVGETEFLLDRAHAGAPVVGGVVGWVDLADPRGADDLERLARDPLLKGVRPMLQDLSDPDWIGTRPAAGCLAALERLGLRFDALVTPRELRALTRFVEAHPALPVMIDHAAKPDLGAPAGDDRSAAWRDGMRALSGSPRVCCKLSGLLTLLPADRLRTAGEAAETLRPVVDDILAWFGPRRLAWGSDWPVVTLAGAPAFWLDVTDRLLSDLDAEDRAAVLGGTAARFYGLAPGGAA